MALSKRQKNHRLYPSANRSPRPDLCEFRRKEAKERQEAYSKLSVKEKIARLNAKFGEGQGAKRQRERLGKLLDKSSNQAPASSPATNKGDRRTK